MNIKHIGHKSKWKYIFRLANKLKFNLGLLLTHIRQNKIETFLKANTCRKTNL